MRSVIIQSPHASGSFFGDAFDIFRQFGVLLNNQPRKVAPIIQDHVERAVFTAEVERLFYAPPVFLFGLPFPRKYGDTRGGDRSGCMILRGERIARRPADFCPQVNKGLNQYGCFYGHVKAAGDASTPEGFAVSIALTNRHQSGHLCFRQTYLPSSPFGEGEVGDFEVLLRRSNHKCSKGTTGETKSSLSDSLLAACIAKSRPSGVRWSDVPQAREIQERWRPLFPDRVPQALLWIGPEGVGKTAGAWMLTKALFCPHGDGIEPCGACTDCQLMDKLEHPNLLLMTPSTPKVPLEEAVQRLRQHLREEPFLSLAEWESLLPEAKGNLSIGVEAARRLQESLSLVSLGNRWRVVWFWHAETLTRQAANALLKIVEEPPARTLFMFLSTRAEALPVTLRSRCQTWHFPPLSKEKLEALTGTSLSAAQFSLSQGSYGRLKRLLSLTLEKPVQSLQAWLRSLLNTSIDPAPAIEELLKVPQLSELLVMGAILIRDHPQLTPAHKAIGMDALLRAAEDIEGNLHPALVLWETTLTVRERWAQPKFQWEWLAP